LRSARDVVHSTTSYEQAVRAAVALGHDTDTTAAVAGGIGSPEVASLALRYRAILAHPGQANLLILQGEMQGMGLAI
jgi:ADP-ribosyl-[dinitrogen reductase] hydrolase